MTILPQTLDCVYRNLLPRVRKKHWPQFEFGIKSLSLTPFRSLNENARGTVANRNTAESKMYRLTSNQGMIDDFHKIIPHLGLINPSTRVNVDFSTFGEFEVLAFGAQTGKGRAIPFWANCITYPITKATSQNIFIFEELKSIKEALGFWPKLVFDRGFMIPFLVKNLCQEEAIFYIRIRAGKHVELPEMTDTNGLPVKLAAKDLPQHDMRVAVYGHDLRLIRSDKPDDGEPWYILTNDFHTTRKRIIRYYYHRFEVEEVFKDQKHLLDLDDFWIKRKQTFKVVLWFVIASFWIAWMTGAIKSYVYCQLTTNAKKVESWIKEWFEGVRREMINTAWNLACLQSQACMRGGIPP
jgi:hypothetical protein